MDKTTRATILRILDATPDLTIATNRADGFPQATTVSFVHDGLKLYFGCGPESQKAKNIARDGRVSIVLNLPYRNWFEIEGLSMAAQARLIEDPAEKAKAGMLFMQRFASELKDLPPADLSQFAFVRIDPKVISILDYKKGFGHTDLVAIEPGDLA